MATIALYAGKINQMPGLTDAAKRSVTDYKSELAALKKKTLTINKSICNVDDVISEIQASTRIQEEKIESLERLNRESEQFIEEVVAVDSKVADIINRRKDEFYEKYSYLKPDCEKSWGEKALDWFDSVGEWCQKHWKALVKILVTVVIVAALGVAAALTGGLLSVILAGALWGALSGALMSGIANGIASVRQGGSFFDGFADGALHGAISGAITGAACSGIGGFLGGSCSVSKWAEGIRSVLRSTSRITGVLAMGMGAFDTLSMVVSLFDPDNPLVQINEKLHSNGWYNVFQMGVTAFAFIGGLVYYSMDKRMNAGWPTCFVAGTLVLTAAGLVAIENIRVGDTVIAFDPDTSVKAEKKVLNVYERETQQLIHLKINNEQITTTAGHPFYVSGKGFVNAKELKCGDEVIDTDNNKYPVENIYVEVADEPEKVYNFEVEDYHTYYVGTTGVLVHNKCAGNGSETDAVNMREAVKYADSPLAQQVKDLEEGLFNKWNKGSHITTADSIIEHYCKHKNQVGATSIAQYIRKADGFSQNLRGAWTQRIAGATEGVIRYNKNGKYIDLASDKTIISFGTKN